MSRTMLSTAASASVLARSVTWSPQTRLMKIKSTGSSASTRTRLRGGSGATEQRPAS